MESIEIEDSCVQPSREIGGGPVHWWHAVRVVNVLHLNLRLMRFRMLHSLYSARQLWSS